MTKNDKLLKFSQKWHQEKFWPVNYISFTISHHITNFQTNYCHYFQDIPEKNRNLPNYGGKEQVC